MDKLLENGSLLDAPKQKWSYKHAQLLLRKLFKKEELTTEILDPENKRHSKTEMYPQKIKKN